MEIENNKKKENLDKNSCFNYFPILLLPVELILRIFTFLNEKELAKISLVCLYFYDLCNDNYIWKQKCESIWTIKKFFFPKDFTTTFYWKNYFIKKWFLSKPSIINLLHIIKKCIYNRNILLVS